jgi:hypothetical protein
VIIPFPLQFLLVKLDELFDLPQFMPFVTARVCNLDWVKPKLGDAPRLLYVNVRRFETRT